MIQTLPLSQIKPNPDNPRVIRDEKYRQLVKSLKEFPEMLWKRPIVVDEDHVALGGNMRLKALEELKFKEVPVIVAEGWTEEQRKQFVVKDNVSYGEWDWDMLSNTWDAVQLNDWGLHVWVPEVDADYTVLDSDEFSGIDERVTKIAESTERGILINFPNDLYDEAYELVKKANKRKYDVGMALLTLLRDELGE